MATYQRPDSLQQSLELLATAPRQIVAGATDVYPAKVSQRMWGVPERATPRCEDWLDITAIPELRSISENDKEWRIGARVSWSELCETPLPSCFDGLKAAAREVGGLQIQNRGTLVGNVCNASPAADGVPPLLCLDAVVEIISQRGIRRLLLSEFILGNRQTALESDEMVSAVCIPKNATLTSAMAASRFYKLGARRYLVISIVMASSIIQTDADGLLLDCRLSVGSCSAVAQRLRLLEAELVGRPISDALSSVVAPSHFAELTPIDDVRSDRGYRKHAAMVAVRTLLDSTASSTASSAPDSASDSAPDSDGGSA